MARYRALMGATNSKRAESGTLRHKYGQSLEAKAVHGSDGPGTSAAEPAFFFNKLERVE